MKAQFSLRPLTPARWSMPLALLIVAGTLAASSPVQPRATREPGAGLLYYAKADYAFAENQRVIANPHIVGALFQVIWSEVEKKEGEYQLHITKDMDKDHHKKMFFINEKLVGFILLGDISESQKLAAAIKNGTSYKDLVK